jgi:hypothetical protein
MATASSPSTDSWLPPDDLRAPAVDAEEREPEPTSPPEPDLLPVPRWRATVGTPDRPNAPTPTAPDPIAQDRFPISTETWITPPVEARSGGDEPLDLPDVTAVLPAARYRGHRGGNPTAAPADTASSEEVAVEAPPDPRPEAGQAAPVTRRRVSGVPTTPADAAETRDPWHHKATAALGFHKPRFHLSLGGTIALIAAALIVIVGLAFGGLALTGHLTSRDTPTAGDTPTPTAKQPGEEGATAWTLGRKFTAGDLTVTVTSYKDQLSALDGEDKWIAVNGQWVIIGITVEYQGADEGAFVPDQQFIEVSDGKTYRNDPSSAMHYQPVPLGAEPLKPGKAQSGYMAFDIPLGKAPTAIKFVGKVGDPPITIPLG